MRQVLLMFILTGLAMGFHSPLYADEAGIGWGEGGNGLAAEEPASEESSEDSNNWFEQLLDLLATEDSE